MKITVTVDLNGCDKIDNSWARDSRASEIEFIYCKGITYIDDYFIHMFNSLESIDLSSFANVTHIGNYFMNYCKLLKYIDLSSFHNVISIGNYFLYECSSLRSIDLTPLTNVTSIGRRFLGDCDSLTDITWPDTEFWNKQREIYEDNN